MPKRWERCHFPLKREQQIALCEPPTCSNIGWAATTQQRRCHIIPSSEERRSSSCSPSSGSKKSEKLGGILIKGNRGRNDNFCGSSFSSTCLIYHNLLSITWWQIHLFNTFSLKPIFFIPNFSYALIAEAFDFLTSRNKDSIVASLPRLAHKDASRSWERPFPRCLGLTYR